MVRTIKRQLVKRALDMLSDIAKREDPADYVAFWEAFGRNIKLGVIEDQGNRDVLAKLLRCTAERAGTFAQCVASWLGLRRQRPRHIWPDACPLIPRLVLWSIWVELGALLLDCMGRAWAAARNWPYVQRWKRHKLSAWGISCGWG